MSLGDTCLKGPKKAGLEGGDVDQEKVPRVKEGWGAFIPGLA